MLPQGRSLPEETWQQRHRVIRWLLWVHVAAIVGFALVRGYPVVHGLGDSSIVAGAALIAGWTGGSRRVRMAAATFGLVSASAVLVHLSGGSIEMHFHFFVMIGVITMYHDWFPFLLAIGFVALHHGVMGAISPAGVYNHPAAQHNPWKWAGIHAFFVLAASVASLVSWRMTEVEREKAEQLLIEIHDTRLRQRQALEINDNVVQGLSVAKYALDIGDERQAYDAVTATLGSAKDIISGLLERSNGSVLGGGDLVREEAANPTTDAA
jgi:signal transduction histidine kinase